MSTLLLIVSVINSGVLLGFFFQELEDFTNNIIIYYTLAVFILFSICMAYLLFHCFIEIFIGACEGMDKYIETLVFQ